MTFYKMTNDDELYHYGRLGMKWYQHIYTSAKEYRAARKRKKKAARAERKQRRKDLRRINKLLKKNPSKMSNAEIKELTDRLQLEKSLKDVKKQTRNSGANWVMKRLDKIGLNTIENVGTNIGTQLGVRLVGEEINKIAREHGFEGDYINPTKGQKEK